jgi:predicted MFS family arabinose efflux permease
MSPAIPAADRPVGSDVSPHSSSNMPRLSPLAPFQVRSYRFQWPADLLTSWAFEMETLILGWYVLVETGSVLLLTVFGALGYGGTLIAPMLGVASDRIGHRAVLAGMRAVYAAVAAALMMLAFAGALTPLLVCVLAALTGLVRPSDMGLRAALIAETMPADRLTAAIGISRTTYDSARVAGAIAGAGLFAAFGMAPAYVAIAAFYLIGALLTLGVEPARRARSAPAPAPQISPWHDLREGIVHVWSTPSLLAFVCLAFLFNLTAYPISNGLLPYVARDIYRIDQTGLGLLVASFSFGALFGSIALSRAGGTTRLPRVMIVSAILWYALLLIFARMQSLPSGIITLMLAGFTQSLSMVAHAVILLRASDQRLRGRIMGVRMLAIYSLPLGLLTAGALIGRIGFEATVTAYALIGLIFTVLIAVRWRASLWGPRDLVGGT